MDTPAASLVVKVTCGTEALERLNQGFTVAATALAAGVEVSLWLTGDATFMAVPGRAELVDLPDAVPLAELRDLLLEGARVTVARRRRRATCAAISSRAKTRARRVLVRIGIVLSDWSVLGTVKKRSVNGATVTVCGQCAARRGLTVDDLSSGAGIRGAAAFVEEVMAPGARSLVY